MTESLPIDAHWKEDRSQSQSCIFDSFRSIAQETIKSLHRKMKATGKRSLYLEKIKEVALDELNRMKTSQNHKNKEYEPISQFSSAASQI